MGAGYALMVCVGCFQAVPLLAGPRVPDRMEIRTLKPEDFRTRCFDSEGVPKPGWPQHRVLEIVSKAR